MKIQTDSGIHSCYLQGFNYEYLVMEKKHQADKLRLLIGDGGLLIEYKYIRSLKKDLYIKSYIH